MNKQNIAAECKIDPVFVQTLVSSRWDEAIERGDDVRTWLACSDLAGLWSDMIERQDPDHILIPMLRGIAHDAHVRYLSLMPRVVA